MHYWRGVITHTIFLLAQPTYLAVRSLLGHGYFKSKSSLNLTIHTVVWVYIATRISIPFFTSPLRRLPSPPGEKFLLCHLNFNGGKPLTALFENMINATPNDGLLVLWLPLYLAYEIIPTRPDTLLDVLNSRNYDWEKPSLPNRVLSAILGEGLANVEGNKHKAMRRVVAPAFSGRRIRDLAPLFYAKGIDLADVMARQRGETDDGVLDLVPLVSRVTLDIIGAAGVGMDFNALENEQSRLAKLYDTVTRPPAFFMLVNMLLPKWFMRRLRGTSLARTVEAQSQLHEEVRALLQAKKAHMDRDNSAQPSKDIIASIMKSGDFSDDYLVSQLLTFLAAG
jgi:Cytochrome P450